MDYGAKWLKKFLEPRIKKSAFSKNTMFVVTFDEDDSNTKSNRVYAALFGPDFKRSSKSRKDHKKYDHYSLLRTIENNVSVTWCYCVSIWQMYNHSGISVIWINTIRMQLALIFEEWHVWYSCIKIASLRRRKNDPIAGWLVSTLSSMYKDVALCCPPYLPCCCFHASSHCLTRSTLLSMSSTLLLGNSTTISCA